MSASSLFQWFHAGTASFVYPSITEVRFSTPGAGRIQNIAFTDSRELKITDTILLHNWLDFCETQQNIWVIKMMASHPQISKGVVYGQSKLVMSFPNNSYFPCRKEPALRKFFVLLYLNPCVVFCEQLKINIMLLLFVLSNLCITKYM